MHDKDHPSGHSSSDASGSGVPARPTLPAAWKLGDEFLPFHPSASHIEPAYRDGWNRCYYGAIGGSPALTLDEWAGVHNELARDHDEKDFEPECPSCTAYRKVDAFLSVISPPIEQATQEPQ